MNGPGCPTINSRGILGLPYLGSRWGDTLTFVRDDFLTRKARQATQVRTQQSSALAPCVNRLLVR